MQTIKQFILRRDELSLNKLHHRAITSQFSTLWDIMDQFAEGDRAWKPMTISPISLLLSGQMQQLLAKNSGLRENSSIPTENIYSELAHLYAALGDAKFSFRYQVLELRQKIKRQ